MKKHKQIKETHESIANKIVAALDEVGIESYIWHVANTGSVYIRFKDSRMCSVRIGDHNGKEKLKYKFNVRTDIHPNHPRWVKDENIWRCFISHVKWKELIPLLQDRHKTIQGWPESKHEYFIPSFKLANKHD